MVFTIKRPASKRFFQLSFEGFRPRGRNKFEQLLNVWAEFIRSLLEYIWNKLTDLFFLAGSFVIFILKLPSSAKSFLVKKLIWSRGKIGRPLAFATVVGVSLVVFTIGEVLSSYDFIASPEVRADYIPTSSDIIPKKEMAVTTLPEMRQRTEPFIYRVESGDTLYSIGNKFKISTDAIKYVNKLSDNSILKIGQEITIPPVAGLIHTVERGDTLSSIAAKYDVPMQAIADFNYLLDTSSLALGTELVIPGGKVPKVVPIAPIYSGVPSTGPGTVAEADRGFCIWPTTVRVITQYYSWYHNGIDIATPRNIPSPPLLACASGTVVRAGWDPFGLGLHVRIDHGDGYETVYGHMSRIDVSYGQNVSRGEVIGLMGSTGRSTGTHVHFMVKYNGIAQDPFNFVQ
ncbi:MAG: hypothetical protein KatS3mg101_0537 [Patescibacteria group bacterium]|nr:MAG: hypothetical protein KatS3mg101_0537 [Patescibacteria group bacterium]